MKDSLYYYLFNEAPQGPVNFQELMELFRLGTIHRDTPVSLKGENLWRPLNEYKELFEEIATLLGLDKVPEILSRDHLLVGLPGSHPKGPYSEYQIQKLIEAGELNRHYFIFDQISQEWIPLYTHPHFDRRRQKRILDLSEAQKLTVPIPLQDRLMKWSFGFLGLLVLVGLGAWVLQSQPKLACQLGSYRGCFKQARSEIQTGQIENAQNYLQKSCAGGLPEACHDLGQVRMQKNEKRAAEELFQSSCNQGLGISCYSLALLQPEGEIRQELMTKACEKDVSRACLFLGEKDLDSSQLLRAQAHFQRACQLEERIGCNALGRLWLELGDELQAQVALQKSCLASSAEGCAALGALYHVQRKLDLAMEAFLKSCEGGNGVGCSGAANLYFLKGAKEKGQEFAQKGCGFGDGVGCGLLANFWKTEGESSEALQLFTKACQLNSALSCLEASQISKSLGRAPAQALELRQKACLLNSKYCSETRPH